jgi:predicted amidophosphoribosyltransferase
MVAILKGHKRYWGKVAIYGDYKPWTAHKEAGGDWSTFDEHSRRILTLKEGNGASARYFADMIEPELADGTVIVTVPSHDPASPGTGLKTLAGHLAKNGGRIDGSGCLVRTKKIEKLAHGGDRSQEIHLQSIVVKNVNLIKGKNILLLDDVTKTGNSLEACTLLLLEAGARSVQRATIGKT